EACGKTGDGPLRDAPQRLWVTQPLELVKGHAVVAPGIGPERGNVLSLEQFPEPLPGHARRFLVPSVVEVALQVAAGLLGLGFVGRLRRLALALARQRVDPLEHEGGAVLEPLHPDNNALLAHAVLHRMPRIIMERRPASPWR